MNVKGVPLELQLEGGETRARVDVFDPLRFTGSYAVEELALRIAAPVDLYGGRIRVGQGAAPKRHGVQGGVLQVSVQEMLGVATKAPLSVPCRRFGLSDGSPYATPSAVVPAPGWKAVGLRHGFIPLHLYTGEGDALWVRYAGPLFVEDRKPGWVLLRAQWSDGSRLRGWTRERYVTAEFNPAPEGWFEGRTMYGDSCGSSHPPARRAVTVVESSPVAAAPNGAVWAQVAREIRVEAYSHSLDRSDGWVELAVVPGLPAGACEPHEHLWVQRAHVVEKP